MSDAASIFLDDDDVRAIVTGLILTRRMDVQRAERLARVAANIRFQMACLENVREGLMLMDLDGEGNPVFILTEEGKRVAQRDRDALALRALLPETNTT